MFTCSLTDTVLLLVLPHKPKPFCFANYAKKCCLIITTLSDKINEHIVCCAHINKKKTQKRYLHILRKLSKEVISISVRRVFPLSLMFARTLSWSCKRSLRSASVRLSSMGSLICSSVSRSRDTSPPASPFVSSSSFSFSSSATWWCCGVVDAANSAAAASA